MIPTNWDSAVGESNCIQYLYSPSPGSGPNTSYALISLGAKRLPSSKCVIRSRAASVAPSMHVTLVEGRSPHAYWLVRWPRAPTPDPSREEAQELARSSGRTIPSK